MAKKTSEKTQTKTASPGSLIETLQARFAANKDRHKGIKWEDVEQILRKKPKTLETLAKMEGSGGEPDVVLLSKSKEEITFVDCSPESPTGRRSLCYDRLALDNRKEHKPKDSAIEMARKIGIRILNEAEYRTLQEYGEFDLKTSSWIQTPQSIRDLDGALFCDRRYNHVFVYHNGASSYYAARGFRGVISL